MLPDVSDLKILLELPSRFASLEVPTKQQTGALVFDKKDPDYTIAGKRLYLSRLIVKEEYRRQGIGSFIVDALINHAFGLGYKEFSIGVDVDNIAARHLYEGKGFTEVIFHGRDKDGEYVKLLKR